MFNSRRDIILWLQSLDLSKQIKSPKWDLANGVLVGEIFNRYYPNELISHSFIPGDSFDSKSKNWYMIQQFIKKKQLHIHQDLILGTICMKENAAACLLIQLHHLLTNSSMALGEVSLSQFDDSYYQKMLPLHAKSTATRTVKNNLSLHETIAQPSLDLNQQKAQQLLNAYKNIRDGDRDKFPGRYRVLKSIGSRCLRNPPAITTGKFVEHIDDTTYNEIEDNPARTDNKLQDVIPQVTVKQPAKV